MKIKIFVSCMAVSICLAFTTWQSGIIEYPEYFPVPDYDFAQNPLNDKVILLGRALFYDPILSKDQTISCASCHSPYNAFAHTDHDLSHGIRDQIGQRNAPALFNLAWHTSFMWDGAINHLDMQALAPISDSKEMDEDIAKVVTKLMAKPLYPKLFFQAFQDSMITGEKVLKALSQFQLTLVSADAKYDRVKGGKEIFTEQEQKGYNLFIKHCNSCHTEPLFSNQQFANNGLPLDTSLMDYGKGEITGLAQDSLQFKVPSLRNLSFTYPYMHDGRFKKLQQVLRHYSEGIVHGPRLSPELDSPIVLDSHEKTDLLSFLRTLNDKAFVFDPNNKYPREILN